MRIAEGKEGPLARRKPGVKSVCFGCDGPATRTGVVCFGIDVASVTGGAVLGGNRNAPDNLAGNIPINSIFHPVGENLFVIFRMEFDFFVITNGLEGELGKRLHFDKPLITGLWFDDCRYRRRNFGYFCYFSL